MEELHPGDHRTDRSRARRAAGRGGTMLKVLCGVMNESVIHLKGVAEIVPI